MNCSRRQITRVLLLASCLPGFKAVLARELQTAADDGIGNFRFIYGNASYSEEFFDFLVNVFHLYPENDMHALIQRHATQASTDQKTYAQAQARLGEIKPALGDLTYALPALRKQKKVIADQTTQLLEADRRYEGYLEIGSTGRYLDSLEEKLNVVGDVFLVSDKPPTNSLVDILDRGQISKAGEFIPMNSYNVDFANRIPAKSLDLVTVYIGFHHCPLALRDDFFTGIRDAMKPGAQLIVRDHDAHDEKMQRIVALAHDVFNMGTQETWDYNARELRNFYSLATLNTMLRNAGFKSDGRRLFQQGDPTLNALMRYEKV